MLQELAEEKEPLPLHNLISTHVHSGIMAPAGGRVSRSDGATKRPIGSRCGQRVSAHKFPLPGKINRAREGSGLSRTYFREILPLLPTGRSTSASDGRRDVENRQLLEETRLTRDRWNMRRGAASLAGIFHSGLEARACITPFQSSALWIDRRGECSSSAAHSVNLFFFSVSWPPTLFTD